MCACMHEYAWMRVVQHRGWCRQGEGEGGRGEEGCTDGMMDEPTANWFEPTTGLNRHLPRSTCARPMRRHHCLLGGRRGSRKVGAAGHFLRTAGHCLRMRPQKNDHDIEQARSATRSQQAIRPSYTCAHSHTRARMCTQHTHACKHARMRHTHTCFRSIRAPHKPGTRSTRMLPATPSSPFVYALHAPQV